MHGQHSDETTEVCNPVVRWLFNSRVSINLLNYVPEIRFECFDQLNYESCFSSQQLSTSCYTSGLGGSKMIVLSFAL